MIGEEGNAITAVHEDGKIFIKGEHWNAFSRKLVEKGERVRVIGINGLKVEVEKIRSEKEE